MDQAQQKILDAIREFATTHPELVHDVAAAAEAGAAIATGTAGPFSLYDVLRHLVDKGLYGGDIAMIEKAHDAIRAHEDEHNASREHAAQAAEDVAAEAAPDTPAPAPAVADTDPRDALIEQLRGQLAALQGAQQTA